MSTSTGPRTHQESIAAVGFVIMWSSGCVGAKLGTDAAGFLTVLMWRFLAAVGLLGVWWLLTQRHRLSVREVGLQAGIGLLAQGVYLFGVFSSVQFGVSPGISSLVTALQPIAVAALAGPVLRQRTSWKQWFGLLVGLVGVALVVSGQMRGGGAPVGAYLLSFMAMAGLVSATLLERKAASATSLADALLIHCLASAALFSVLAVGTGNATPPQDGKFWLSIAWLVGLSTIGGYGFYWLNLRIGSVTRVNSLIYLTPPVTMLWAFVMFGDTIGPVAGIGMCICFGAVLLVRHAKPRHTDQHASAPHPVSAGGPAPS